MACFVSTRLPTCAPPNHDDAKMHLAWQLFFLPLCAETPCQGHGEHALGMIARSGPFSHGGSRLAAP
jgi:hypothetical protein